MGLSMNAIAKQLGVSTPSILNWIRAHAATHAPRLQPDPGESVVVMELDELWHFLQKNKNGKTGCLLRLSGGVERGARDVTVLVPSKAGGRANPGSGPCHLSGVRTGDADPLQQPSGHCVAAGSGSGAPEDPAL